jgi:hypothetical protein
VFDLPSTESWIEQEELTPAMETAQHFHVVAGTNAQGVDFEIRVALPALRGAFWRALLMISDGNGQTNICPIAHTTGDTGEITFATFSVAKQCLPSSKFQVWFHVDPDRARVYWFWLRHFSKAD